MAARSARVQSPEPEKMEPGTGGLAVAGKIMNILVNMAALSLCIKQTFIAYSDGGELVFDNFSLTDKSVSCFKLFITAYYAVHTKGSEMFGFVCMFGLFLLSYAVATHLNMNHKAWARTRIIAMATIMAAGVFLLCRGMVIPRDHAWHRTVVPAIIIFVISLEAGLFVHNQINEDGVNQNLRRDLHMKLAETSISMYRCVDLAQRTRCPWDAEKILHLVGSGLPVLIGACQIGWIVYKAGIMREVVDWLRKLPRIFAGEEKRAHEAANGGVGEGDGKEQVEEEGDGVV